MMQKIRFSIEKSYVGASTNVAYVADGETPFEALSDAVMEDIRTDLMVTVSGVTMFLAAWQDPDHWASDWAEKLGVDFDEAPGAVENLLAEAQEVE